MKVIGRGLISISMIMSELELIFIPYKWKILFGKIQRPYIFSHRFEKPFVWQVYFHPSIVVFILFLFLVYNFEVI